MKARHELNRDWGQTVGAGSNEPGTRTGLTKGDVQGGLGRMGCCNSLNDATARSAGQYKTGPCGLNITSAAKFPRTFLCVVIMTDDAQSLEEQCGTSAHAAQALLTILQEQKIKQAMA
jgi:hypothetical protein